MVTGDLLQKPPDSQQAKDCQLVVSVEPLAVLLAKLGKQMMGDKRLLLPFSAQIASR